MARLLSVIVMVGVVVLAGAAMASTAFTTAEVQRNADLTVEADGGAVIQITPGSGGGADYNARGKVVLSLNNLNKDSAFEFGNYADPDGGGSPSASDYVFKFTNNDGTSHTFNVGANKLPSGVSFKVDDTSTTYTFNGNASTSDFSLSDGNTAYVAVDITNSSQSSANFTAGEVYINATG